MIARQRQKPVAVAKRAGVSQRVDESQRRERSRGRGRKRVEARKGDDIGHDQRVPEASEGCGSSEVHPQQRNRDDRELRAPVRERNQGIEGAGVARQRLQTQLDKAVDEVSLEFCDAQAICERLAPVVARASLDELVTQEEREPERCLKSEIDSSARAVAGFLSRPCSYGRPLYVGDSSLLVGTPFSSSGMCVASGGLYSVRTEPGSTFVARRPCPASRNSLRGCSECFDRVRWYSSTTETVQVARRSASRLSQRWGPSSTSSSGEG